MKTNFIGLASLLMFFAACNDSQNDPGDLNPGGNETKTLVSIKYPGKIDFNLYDTNDPVETFPYIVRVEKSGTDPVDVVQAELKLMSQEDVNEYSAQDGKNYQIIPAEYYTLENAQVKFDANTKTHDAKVVFNPTKIKEFQKTQPENVTYVLPLELAGEDEVINPEANRAFLVINPVTPVAVGFVDTNPFYATFFQNQTNQQFTQKVSIGLNIDNKWNIDCEVGAADQAFVDSYNTENGTNYTLLPAGNYSFNSTVTIPETASAAEFEITLKNTAELGAGEYLLPLKIVQTDKFNASETVYPVIINNVMEFDRTGWTADANNYEDSEDADAENLLDNDNSTIWHSKWAYWNGSGGLDGYNKLPYCIVIDAKKEYDFRTICMIQRLTNSDGDTKDGEFYISSDEITIDGINNGALEGMQPVGTFSMKRNAPGADPNQLFDITPTRGRYLVIKITSSHIPQDSRSHPCSLSEVRAYGFDVTSDTPEGDE